MTAKEELLALLELLPDDVAYEDVIKKLIVLYKVR